MTTLAHLHHLILDGDLTDAARLCDQLIARYEESAPRDPDGIDQHYPGAKLDAGKLPLPLVLHGFARALLSVAEVSAYGAAKYTPGGWQHVERGVERYTAALQRHHIAEAIEQRDHESGLLHAAHAAWNALARLELMLRADAQQGDAFAEQHDTINDLSRHVARINDEGSTEAELQLARTKARIKVLRAADDELLAWMKTPASMRIPLACWEENETLYDVARAAMRVTQP